MKSRSSRLHVAFDSRLRLSCSVLFHFILYLSDVKRLSDDKLSLPASCSVPGGEVLSQQEIPHSATGLSLNMEYTQRHYGELWTCLKGTGTYFQQGGATKTGEKEQKQRQRDKRTAYPQPRSTFSNYTNIPTAKRDDRCRQHTFMSETKNDSWL